MGTDLRRWRTVAKDDSTGNWDSQAIAALAARVLSVSACGVAEQRPITSRKHACEVQPTPVLGV